MLQNFGSDKPSKQATGYTFCKSSAMWEYICRQYKTIVQKMSSAGHEIVAYLCDQGLANSTAINELIKEKNYFGNGNDVSDNVIIVGGQHYSFPPSSSLNKIH